MSSAVRATSDERFEVVLQGEPPFCHALGMAPARREDKLNQGSWLVLAFAVWSGPDQKAIAPALAAVKRFSGQVQLGLRPFDEYEEIKAWCPEILDAVSNASPQWVLLRDGAMKKAFFGSRSEQELASLLQRELTVAAGELVGV